VYECVPWTGHATANTWNSKPPTYTPLDRPDVITSKTREAEWQQLRSNWRLVHSIFVYLGPPSYILWNIKWPLLFNMIIAAAAYLDSIIQCVLLLLMAVPECIP
jgi:hypothetical protein